MTVRTPGTGNSLSPTAVTGRSSQSFQAPGGRLFTFSFCCLLVAIFALSLTLDLVHHFLCDHAYVMFAFDGKHYLTTCQAMTGALLLLLKGDPGAFFATIGGVAFGKNLVWDGPIIPGLPALFFALIGRLPQESDWSFFAIFFSVLASLSAVLVAISTRILTASNKLALTAGLLFALYPTTLIVTAIYRSEILALPLMLVLLLALYEAPQSRGAAIAAGIAAGVFALVKPGMIPAIGLLCLFAGLHARGMGNGPPAPGSLVCKARLLALLAFAGVLTIAPWSIYTALDCGKLSITAERGPSYNAGVGTDLGADGWCTMPETAHTAEAKLNKSPMAVFVSQWRAHSLALAKLTMRRVTRLWANPWNDYREAVFGLPVQAQAIWHLIFVTMGFMGLSLFVFFPPQKVLFGGDSRLFGNLAAIALLGHLAFVLFQTMGRYAYTSMPLFAIFAAYGLGRLHNRVRDNLVPGSFSSAATIATTAVAALGVVMALFVFNCDALTHVGESHETAHILHPGEIAGRAIDFSQQPLPDLTDVLRNQGALLVMVDCAMEPGDQSDLAVRLNGHLLPGPLLPLNCFNGNNYFLFDTMAEHAAFMRTRVQNFRQWRAVMVEPQCSLLSKDGLNEIELINNGKRDITVFADAQGGGAEGAGQPLLLPSPDYFASDRMLVSLTSMESRINTLSPVEGLAHRSYLKICGKHQRDIWSQKDTFRLRLGLVASRQAAPGQAEAVPVFSPLPQPPSALEISLSPGQFHWFARTKEGLRLNRAVLKGVGAVNCDVDLSSLGATGGQCTQLAVTLTGQVRNSGPGGGRGSGGRLGIAAGLSSKQGLYQGLGQFADCLPVPRAAGADEHEGWTAFQLDDVVPLSRLGGLGNLDKVSIGLLPCSRLEACYGAGKQCSDIEVKDLHLSCRPLCLTDIAAKTLSVY